MLRTPRPLVWACCLLYASSPLAAQNADSSIAAYYRDASTRIIRAALADSSAYDRLGRMVDGFGHRLSGSAALERTIDWTLAEMKRDGLDHPRTPPVKVPPRVG